MSEQQQQQKQQDPKSPVSLDTHYGLVKNVEEKVHQHLNSLDHEYFVIGLRVGYDEIDSSSEPGVLPYKVEFGYLGPVDMAARCTEEERLGEEELAEAAKSSPIPLEFLDELQAYSKEVLEAEAGTSLRVGVVVVLTGSPTLGYSVDCPCTNHTKKQYCYYDKNSKTIRCYCTTKSC